jgi:hypothetical protein
MSKIVENDNFVDTIAYVERDVVKNFNEVINVLHEKCKEREISLTSDQNNV